MGKEILIVDDCKFTTKVLSQVMRELGFETSEGVGGTIGSPSVHPRAK